MVIEQAPFAVRTATFQAISRPMHGLIARQDPLRMPIRGGKLVARTSSRQMSPSQCALVIPRTLCRADSFRHSCRPPAWLPGLKKCAWICLFVRKKRRSLMTLQSQHFRQFARIHFGRLILSGGNVREFTCFPGTIFKSSHRILLFPKRMLRTIFSADRQFAVC